MRNFGFLLVFTLVFFSCERGGNISTDTTLATDISNTSFELDAVIACAASEKNTGNILIFFYPESGAVNFKLYETSTADVDKNDFNAYKQVVLQNEAVFNGYLRRFSQKSTTEKWVIVTVELDNEVKISNPIRVKHLSKPTLWEDIIHINQNALGMPLFSWEDNFAGDNAIYFQVISDQNNNLLTGTYTNANKFQYYKLTNVVLNITTEQPPILVEGGSYNFTLMDVSADNWVNVVTLNKTFIVE